MKLIRCDRKGCGKEWRDEPDHGVFLKGYHPDKAGGILLPENFKTKDFCSHECFVEYMRWALTKEGP